MERNLEFAYLSRQFKKFFKNQNSRSHFKKSPRQKKQNGKVKAYNVTWSDSDPESESEENTIALITTISSDEAQQNNVNNREPNIDYVLEKYDDRLATSKKLNKHNRELAKRVVVLELENSRTARMLQSSNANPEIVGKGMYEKLETLQKKCIDQNKLIVSLTSDNQILEIELISSNERIIALTIDTEKIDKMISIGRRDGDKHGLGFDSINKSPVVSVTKFVRSSLPTGTPTSQTTWRFIPTCHFCGALRHIQNANCSNIFLGCSRHMTGEKSCFLEISTECVSGMVNFGDGRKSKILGKGKIMATGTPSLDNVLLVENLQANLISLSQLFDEIVEVETIREDTNLETHEPADVTNTDFEDYLISSTHCHYSRVLVFHYSPYLSSVASRWSPHKAAGLPPSPLPLDHSLSHFVRHRYATNPHSVITPGASRSRPSSSRRSRSTSASRASHHPPISHFVSPACSTRYTDVVCHRPLLIEDDFDLSSFGSTFVEFLTQHRLLPLVRGISIPLSFHFISAVLGQALIRSGNSCEPVPDFLPCHQLVNRLYVKVSWKAAHILFQLVIEHSVSVEFYIRESLIAVGAANATVLTRSLVLPRIITSLATHASVHALSTDDIGSSNTIKVNNHVTLHLSSHCTSGNFSIEQ
ncbi:hypothetical protein L3X38_038992 [Prunus dulcis]|uniref:Retrovirus-related Pol polyprotein from transposon TNT 1-94-like beta-barrel domain-containing protein n=1 Tax=Prunus dulcis TaxID=3755 RepID=A0AAD4YS63_PRUDU|nr:hypothetical protein L3X38_038992 [Prunus dulcis]